jgi:hypothetical protein
MVTLRTTGVVDIFDHPEFEITRLSLPLSKGNYRVGLTFSYLKIERDLET